MKEINLLNDAMFKALFRSEEAHKQDLSDSYETGYDDGVKKEKIEIAKVMLSKNIDIKDISDITGLSIEEIEEIEELQ